MGYTSNYAKKSMAGLGKDKPAKSSSRPEEKKKVKVFSNGKNVGANFTRQDAKDWKKTMMLR